MIDPSILVSATNPSTETPVVTPGETNVGELFLRAQSAEDQARILATVVELQTQLDQCSSFDAACQNTSSSLSEFLTARHVQIAWRAKSSGTIRIVTMSGPTDSDSSLYAASAAEETCVRDEIAIWPSSDPATRHSLLAVKQYAKAIGAASIAIAPLGNAKGKSVGALMVIDSKFAADQQQKMESFLCTAAQPITQKLLQLERMQPRSWERTIRSFFDRAHSNKRKTAIAVMALICGILCIPVPYQIGADCELQPVQRRFVAAPFDGPLAAVNVRPGDEIKSGQVLASIDPREIEFQLAGLRADLSKADQEKKGLMVEHDVAGSKIAELETRRIELETSLLEHQRDHLAIRSPLSGIVVSGDLIKSVGTPLKRGETMFEVAPLGEMVVEVAISEEDLTHVRVGMEVEFYLHALPERRMRGKLQRVNPQAELRDQKNVFVGEVLVSDPDNVLRPGMRGRAWVKGDRKMLGWNLFHKAYYATRNAMGW